MCSEVNGGIADKGFMACHLTGLGLGVTCFADDPLTSGISQGHPFSPIA